MKIFGLKHVHNLTHLVHIYRLYYINILNFLLKLIVSIERDNLNTKKF